MTARKIIWYHLDLEGVLKGGFPRPNEHLVMKSIAEDCIVVQHSRVCSWRDCIQTAHSTNLKTGQNWVSVDKAAARQ
jgi:hypothetical protein